MINKNYFELLIMYEYKSGVLKELFPGSLFAGTAIAIWWPSDRMQV